MERTNLKPLIYDFTYESLKTLLKSREIPGFVADQIFHWIYKKHQPANLDSWINVSKTIKESLQREFDFSLPQILWEGKSQDQTRKFLVKMRDGETVESVVIVAKDRLTLCLSTQVGCAIGCTFCHTGTQGLKRHLQVGEIVGQFMAVTQWLQQNPVGGGRLTNIVYMGQGEPLHNFENVKAATQLFLDTKGIGLSQRKITLSTSGLVPQIKKLGEFPPVNVAISLHAAHNHIRTQLMPINKVYDLNRLFEAIAEIPLKAYRRITYEYLLIDGLNNRTEDIAALTQLLQKKKSKINLIPFNEYPGSQFRRPSPENIQWFCEELIGRGFTCTVRTTKGTDILAACGQLKSQKEKPNLWNQSSP